MISIDIHEQDLNM